MERCDGYQGSVWRYGKVRQLTRSVCVWGGGGGDSCQYIEG